MKSVYLLFFLAIASVAQAQIGVTISIKDRFYLLHEPVLATVNITNLTGHEITLSDGPGAQWFGFHISTDNDRDIRPRDLNYHVPPLTIKAGMAVRRTVNLTQLYELDEMGSYRISPSIYYDGLEKYFGGRPAFIIVNEGRVVWGPQTVGVPVGSPDAGQLRQFTLLSHQRGEVNTLYVRVVGKDEGTIYCTTPIGRLLDNTVPQVEFDNANNLYILHIAGTHAYLLTRIGSNGVFGGQSAYTAPKSHPFLRKTPEGALQLVGAKLDSMPVDPSKVPVPSLSYRPPGFPTN